MKILVILLRKDASAAILGAFVGILTALLPHPCFLDGLTGGHGLPDFWSRYYGLYRYF